MTQGAAQPAVTSSSGAPLPQPSPLTSGRMHSSTCLTSASSLHGPTVRTHAPTRVPNPSRSGGPAHTSTPAPAPPCDVAQQSARQLGVAPGTMRPKLLSAAARAYLAAVNGAAGVGSRSGHAGSANHRPFVTTPRSARPGSSAHSSASAPAPAPAPVPAPTATSRASLAAGGGAGASRHPGHSGGAGGHTHPSAASGSGTTTFLASARAVVRSRTGGLGGAGSATGGQATQAASSSVLLQQPEFLRLLGIFERYQSNDGDDASTRATKAKQRATSSDYQSVKGRLAIMLGMPADSTTRAVEKCLHDMGGSTAGVPQLQRLYAPGQITLAKIEHWLSSRQIVCEREGVLELSIRHELWESMLGQLSVEELRSLIFSTLLTVPGEYGLSVIVAPLTKYDEQQCLQKLEFMRLLGIFKRYQSNDDDDASTRAAKASQKANSSHYQSVRARLAVMLGMPAGSTTRAVERCLNDMEGSTAGVPQPHRFDAPGQITLARIEHWLSSRKIVCERGGRLELSIRRELWESTLSQLPVEELRSLIFGTLVKTPGEYGLSVIVAALTKYGEQR